MGEWPTTSAVPEEMQVVAFRTFGPPEVLNIESAPTPAPGPGEVLVRVAAVSVGRLLDTMARAGKQPWAKYEFPHVLGAENAGVIAQAGAGVDSVAVGDRVAVFPVIRSAANRSRSAGLPELDLDSILIGTHRQGAYAEYIVVPAENVHPVPDGVSATDAAALALAGAVGMTQFERVGGVGPDSRVLVPGATSALGCTTALLARHFGARVVVTSRNAIKRHQLRAHGFEHVVDSASESYGADILSAFDGAGPDIVVDNLGEPAIWRRNLDILAPGGAIVSSGALLGTEMSIDLRQLYRFSQRVVGVRTGSLDAFHSLWMEVERGLRPVVDRVFDLQQAPEAHRYVERDANVGRVLLSVN